MEKLKKKIEAEGTCLGTDLIKVDAFLNHQIDPVLMEQIATTFYEQVKDLPITKIVTIESGGIAPAYALATKLRVPLLFMKKSEPNTMEDPLYTQVFSYTKQKAYTLWVERKYLSPHDKILFLDDFLANGEAFKGAERLILEAGGEIVGVAALIEKVFQAGHTYIVDKHYPLFSLAPIQQIENGKIQWADSLIF